MKQAIRTVLLLASASACTQCFTCAAAAAADDPPAAPAPAPVPAPAPAPEPALTPSVPQAAPPVQLPADLPAVVKLLCDFYRTEPFAERINVTFTATGKREPPSTVIVRSRGGGRKPGSAASTAAATPEIPELLVEAGPLILLITPAAVTAVPTSNGSSRPIYWSTPVATVSGAAPASPRTTLPTHNELARLVAPLPLPQLALMQPDAADRFLSSDGLSLLFQLPGAHAQTFTASSATITGHAQTGSRSNPTITQTSGWTMTLSPESARLRSLKLPYSGGTLLLAISPINGPTAAYPAAAISTTNRRRVADLAELGRTLATAAPGDPAMALGDLAITTPGKVSSADGAPPPKKVAQLFADKPGPLLLMIHRPTLDAAKSSINAARDATEALEKAHRGQTQVLRLAGADAVLATPEPVLVLSSQQLDRLIGDYEALLIVISAGPECTVLAKAGLLPGQAIAPEVIARFSQLLQAP